MRHELPDDDVASVGPEQDRVEDGAGEARPDGQPPEPEPEDDGSIPPKQIHRWKGEGGSVLPSD